MMARVLLTLLVGLVVSLGASVSGGFFAQAQAGNWNPKNGKQLGCQAWHGLGQRG